MILEHQNDKVILSGGNGIARFYYRYSELQNFVELASDGNECPFVGVGEYSVHIGNEWLSIDLKTGNEIILNSDEKRIIEEITNEWDFNKVPKSEYKNIVELVKKQDWKKLVTSIHHKYRLSTNGYCCDLTVPKQKFIEFANSINGK